ncbi:MAG TPA: four helix bundle protein [Candidatus Omnitrophica bacterium]|nr:MAG: four helix bundle protein [Candidatus Omnitrophota bacterium]HEC68918.1 four helix bundle protein [Candidatus Omnitrophota bacterium]
MDGSRNNRKKGDELAERLLDFAAQIIKFVNTLPKTIIGRYIGGQLLRSGTSPGSNYEEGRGAESRADFIHKLGIVLKELKESRFWLRLIQRTALIKSERLEPLIQECQELCAIVAKSILTARGNK